MAAVQYLVPYAFREHEIGSHDCVLPCDFIFRNIRVLVIVTFGYDLVIHRMVEHLHPERAEKFIFTVIGREEAHIEVGGRHRHLSRLGGIQ